MAAEQGSMNYGAPGDAPPPYPAGTSSDKIKRDIDRTRAQMDQTVDALGDRLRPRHLLDDLLELFRGSPEGGGSKAGNAAASARDTVRDAGSKVLDKLRAHPIPAALIGAGITWMLFEDENSSTSLKGMRAGQARMRHGEPGKWRDLPEYSGSVVDARTGQPYDVERYGSEYRSTGDSGDSPTVVGRGAVPAGGVSGDTAGAAGPGVAGRAKEAVAGAAETARDKLSGAAQSLRESAGSARQGVDRGWEYLGDGMERYPLAMGAAALALGVLAGLAFPSTRTEDRLMGDAADEVKGRAKEAGEDLMDRGRRVAGAAASGAAGAADEQDMNPDSLAAKVGRVAGEVKDAARSAAEREGIGSDDLKRKAQDVAARSRDAAKEEASRQRPDRPAADA